jgi:hypothetical protein
LALNIVRFRHVRQLFEGAFGYSWLLYSRTHNSAQPQFIIGPQPHAGEEHVGEYPDVVSAWHAAQK